MKYIYFLLFIGLLSCSTETTNELPIQEEKADTKAIDIEGNIENHIYTNEFFGFELYIPIEWLIMPEILFDERTEITADSLTQSEYSQDELKKSYTTLLYLEKDQTPDSLYSYIVFYAEDMREMNTGESKHFEVKESLSNTSDSTKYPYYVFGPIKSQKTIGGKSFQAQPIFVWRDKFYKESQMTYVREFGDYVLVVEIGGVRMKAEIAEAKELLNTVHWYK